MWHCVHIFTLLGMAAVVYRSFFGFLALVDRIEGIVPKDLTH